MLIRGVTLPDGRRADIRVEDGTIDAIGRRLHGEPVINASGMRAMPGAVDVHVHFREPGASHKETWKTGTRAAAAGGVTVVVDQPNTDPPTVTPSAVEEKAAIAEESAIVDFGINGGVTPEWDPDGLLAAPITALGEVFMADSTGDLGIGADTFAEALEAAAEADTLVTVHAEDDRYFDEGATNRDEAAAWSDYRRPVAEVTAATRACSLAGSLGVRVHIAHASTPGAIDRAIAAGATCEVSPHHLLLSTDDLKRLDTYGRMNPPLRDESVRAAVYDRVRRGAVTMIATDHAPHTIEEKETDIWSAPSGVPGVETMLPLMLAEAGAGRLGYDDVARLTAAAPARRFGFAAKGRIAPGMDADLVLFNPDETRSIDAESLTTACGWTPFEGYDGVFPHLVLRRGEPVYRAPWADDALPAPAGGGRFVEAGGRNLAAYSSD